MKYKQQYIHTHKTAKVRAIYNEWRHHRWGLKTDLNIGLIVKIELQLKCSLMNY